MKRNLKKHLTLAAIIAVLLTLFTFGTSAACDKHVYNSALDKFVAPTCTEGGYTVMYCGVCQEEIGVKDELNALGHLFNAADYYYVAQNSGEYYTYECDCARNCGAHTIKTDESVNPVKFYTVTFFNTYVTSGYDSTVTYTKLANAWTTKQVGKVYVSEGDNAVYLGSAPYREKDKTFGEYSFTGWDVSLQNITQNTVANAVFEGVPVHYTVIFVDGDGKLISSNITVTHGQHDPKILTLFQNNPPTKSETTLFKYEFTGWDKDIYAFYDTCTVVPLFNTIEKEYTYVYHDSNGNEFYRAENLSYSDKAPVFTNEQKSEYIAKADDEKYMYQWTGEWCWNNNSNVKITVPKYIPGSLNEGDEIHLYPVYIKKLIDYDVVVRISFLEESPYYSLDGFIVQLKNAEGQLIASGYTDEVGEFHCKINYSYPVYVTVMSTDNRCSGQATINMLYNGYTTSCHILLDANASVDNPAYNCGCLCHNSMIKPIWVRVLNILYNLFKIKFVCCDDMYSSIGDLLVYTQ